MEKPYIVGITGGSASGKTTVLKSIINSFGEEDICLVSQDNYYKPRNQQPVDENGVHNFDKPVSIDFESFRSDIISLMNGETVKRQEYVFNNPSATPTLIEWKPAPIIIVEGLFVFYDEAIEELLDLKVFIDAKEHIKLKRRIIRDSEERGYDLEDVLYRYEKHVIPTYERYINPLKDDADMIIPNNNCYKKGTAVLVEFLRNKLEKS
ncbi:uridine kinase [Aureibacter tunicatorum]|uniref:uridine/cytidine kinase n=1 Tax=Aureibacter tunicatorum TaxID=866807 RepID=A0AAE3XKB6_9BACT|nr:uridine kinase [Aureibacter tunicatorum]MDR6237997.1 uridine kinase [Aureibacter tunicatorum]BDD03030.1 uridine kinase [Aureibacter tunicatorum]